MKIHLVRSPELKKETFHNVVNILHQYPGPLKFLAIEDGGIVPSSIQTRTWDNDEDFTTKKIPPSANYAEHNQIFRFPEEEKMRTWEQLFEHCVLYRTKHRVSTNDIVVLLTDDNNNWNWFGGVAPNMKDYFIQTSNWEAYFGDVDVRYPIAYEVMVWVMRYYMFENINDMREAVHHTPIGCVMDFCKDKSQIILKMRTADVCPDCMKVLKDRDISPFILKQFFAILEGIRSGMTFKSRAVLLYEPSKLIVKRKAKMIIFKEMGDLQLSFTPKEIALYCLFLETNTAEGIHLNELKNYKTNLINLYKDINASTDKNQAIQAIELLIGESPNDRDMTISRINSKIKNAVGEELAEFYIIKGERGGAKKIKLDREKVIWKN